MYRDNQIAFEFSNGNNINVTQMAHGFPKKKVNDLRTP